MAGVLETAFARVSLSARLVNAIPYLPPGLLANCRVHPRANCQVKPRARRASRQGARTPRAGSPAAPRPSPTLRAHTARHALLLPLSSPVWRLNGYVFFFGIKRRACSFVCFNTAQATHRSQRQMKGYAAEPVPPVRMCSCARRLFCFARERADS